MQLPKPTAIYSGLGARFEVYRAKDLSKNKWNNGELKKITLLTRSSYSKYGKRKLLDPVDSKAAIYLARAIYKKNNLPVEEWLSIRMTPGDGKPLGVMEPEIYSLKNRALHHHLKEKFFRNHPNFWEYIVSSSRMCRLQPQYINKKSKSVNLPKSHKYTNIEFALIHYQFILDYEKENKKYKYVTAIIRDDLMRKVLAVKRGRGAILPHFMPAHKAMKVKKSEIKLDRGIYAYEFPAYWLNLKQLNNLLANLVKQRFLPKKYDLAKLLTTRGKIKGGEMSGEDLRRIVDMHVDDAPELKITPIKKWNDAIKKIIKISGIKKI